MIHHNTLCTGPGGSRQRRCRGPGLRGSEITIDAFAKVTRNMMHVSNAPAQVVPRGGVAGNLACRAVISRLCHFEVVRCISIPIHLNAQPSKQRQQYCCKMTGSRQERLTCGRDELDARLLVVPQLLEGEALPNVTTGRNRSKFKPQSLTCGGHEVAVL